MRPRHSIHSAKVYGKEASLFFSSPCLFFSKNSYMFYVNCKKRNLGATEITEFNFYRRIQVSSQTMGLRGGDLYRFWSQCSRFLYAVQMHI